MTDVTMSKFTMIEAIAEVIYGRSRVIPTSISCQSKPRSVGSVRAEYMDHIWTKHRWWTQSDLVEPPSTYFHRQVSATFMEDPVGLANRELIGVDNIMWSSDYPHSETTWPDSKRLTDEWMTEIPPDERQKIVVGTRYALFRL